MFQTYHFIAFFPLNPLGPELNAGCVLQKLGIEMAAITLQFVVTSL
jgi:hypothetical protein